MRRLLGAVLLLGVGASPQLLAQDDVPVYSCAAQAVWINCPNGRGVSGTSRQPVALHLLAHVSRPADECLRAWVDLSATYLNARGDVVCTGRLDRIATVQDHSQELAFEVGPTVLRTFARWTNEPGRRVDSPFEAMRCVAADGRSELLDTHLEEASVLSITAAVLPASGGLATAECTLEIER